MKAGTGTYSPLEGTGCPDCLLVARGLLPLYAMRPFCSIIDAPDRITVDVQLCTQHAPLAIDPKLVRVRVSRTKRIRRRDGPPPGDDFEHKHSRLSIHGKRMCLGTEVEFVIAWCAIKKIICFVAGFRRGFFRVGNIKLTEFYRTHGMRNKG